jgi:hypothetical protein
MLRDNLSLYNSLFITFVFILLCLTNTPNPKQHQPAKLGSSNLASNNFPPGEGSSSPEDQHLPAQPAIACTNTCKDNDICSDGVSLQRQLRPVSDVHTHSYRGGYQYFFNFILFLLYTFSINLTDVISI